MHILRNIFSFIKNTSLTVLIVLINLIMTENTLNLLYVNAILTLRMKLEVPMYAATFGLARTYLAPRVSNLWSNYVLNVRG